MGPYISWQWIYCILIFSETPWIAQTGHLVQVLLHWIGRPRPKWGVRQCVCVWHATESPCKLFSSVLTSGISFHYKAIECKGSFEKRWRANGGHASRNLNIASKSPSLWPEQWLPPKLDGGTGSAYSCLVCLLRSIYIHIYILYIYICLNCFLMFLLSLVLVCFFLRFWGWRSNLSKAVDMVVKHAWIIPQNKV